ncbi:MAG: alpha/beta fold hydrolase [Pseudomonadales bacterium]|nr:alpha/beta fold hydrolase [Pseudomonadales bacterium]
MTHGAPIEKFSPAWWLPGGHSQTLYRKFSPTDSVRQQRERVELEDGDFIDLDWCADAPIGAEASEVTVFILHGLCGCSSSSYVLSLQALLSQYNVSSVVMNFRGCSGEVNKKAKAYHSGVSEDVDEVFSKLSDKYPTKNFVCVGYSLGANVLLKWLGEIKQHSRISKVAAVSTPFSLSYCSKAMLSGLSQFYGKYFVWRLVSDLQSKIDFFRSNNSRDELDLLQNLGDLTSIRTIWEFDDLVTAPLNGFAHAEDYYNQCSSKKFLSNIQTETLLIQSSNDPLIPQESIPNTETLQSNVHLHLDSAGGHVGFIAGNRDKWLEHQLMRYLVG